MMMLMMMWPTIVKEAKQVNTIGKQHAWVIWLQREQSSRREGLKAAYISHDPPLPPCAGGVQWQRYKINNIKAPDLLYRHSNNMPELSHY